MEKYGKHTCVYMVVSPYGNFKYMYNRRPNDNTFQDVIKFSPVLDGELDFVYKCDCYYLEQRWRVFSTWIDDYIDE